MVGSPLRRLLHTRFTGPHRRRRLLPHPRPCSTHRGSAGATPPRLSCPRFEGFRAALHLMEDVHPRGGRPCGDRRRAAACRRPSAPDRLPRVTSTLLLLRGLDGALLRPVARVVAHDAGPATARGATSGIPARMCGVMPRVTIRVIEAPGKGDSSPIRAHRSAGRDRPWPACQQARKLRRTPVARPGNIGWSPPSRGRLGLAGQEGLRIPQLGRRKGGLRHVPVPGRGGRGHRSDVPVHRGGAFECL